MKRTIVAAVAGCIALTVVADGPRVERRKPLTANVGVVSVGLDTYWDQCPGLLKDMQEKEQVFVRKLKSHQVKVTRSGCRTTRRRRTRSFPR